MLDAARAPVVVLAPPAVRTRLTAWLRQAGHRVRQPPADRTPRRGHLLGTRAPGTESRHGHLLGHARTASHPARPGALVTHLSEAIGEAVTDDLLAQLAPPALWLQLAPLPLADVRAVSARADAAGVTLVHAPYLEDPAGYALPADPTVQDRPSCLVYSSVAPGLPGIPDQAAALICAVAWQPRWTGPLEKTSPLSRHRTGDSPTPPTTPPEGLTCPTTDSAGA